MGTQHFQLPLPPSSSSSTSTAPPLFAHPHHLRRRYSINSKNLFLSLPLTHVHHRHPLQLVRVTPDDSEPSSPSTATALEEEDEDYLEPTPDDLEYISQIKRVLELLKKNRDMLFGEVKLTIMIEDPREVERKRLLGIDDSDGPTREDLVAALEEVNDGKVPKNRAALRMLAEEMINWPNLEVEAPKKGAKSKSLYAKATDTGIDPDVAAKRLNVDWDSAADFEEPQTTDDTDVPSAVGYGALYLVTAFPIIIGIAVVLILFYNSLQ